MTPTTRHIGEKAKERRGRKENQNSNIAMMETKVIHPMRMAKERADMKKGNPRRSQPPQRRRRSSPPSSRLHHPYSLPMPVGQTKTGINHGHGTNMAGTHPMRHPAQDKRYWHSMMHMSIMRKRHPREADPIRYSFRTQSVRRNKSQPSGNKADGACHQPSAQSDLCDSGQWMYQIYGQLACHPAFYSGHRTNEGHHLISVHPGRDQVHFCKQRDRQGKLDPASWISHNSSMQYQHRRP